MERDYLKDLDTDSRIMLQEIGWEGMGWILLAVDMDQCQAAVNTVMIHMVLQDAGSFWTVCGTVSF